ncbi:serine hydrolase domain-containing protein [soil metagenome]
MDAALQHALQRQLNRWQFFAPCPGANVTIIDSLRGTWHGASGHADIDTLAAMTPNASSYIYSITKTFTAVRILQLSERGALALDDQVAAHLPELEKLPAISIRQLLNHTAGIPSYTDLLDYLPANRKSPSVPWTYDEILKLCCSGKMDFAPGEGWHYSNTGYMLLRRLIEKISNLSFADSIKLRIAAPLGLKKTYVATAVDAGTLTPGYCPYLNEEEVMQDVMRFYHPGWCLTGLIVSSTEEIARFYAALFERQLIGAASLEEMTAWVPTVGAPHPFFVKPGYGLGLMIDPGWKYGGFHGHGGDGPGFNTFAAHFPDFHGRAVTMVVFCNATIGSHPFKLVKSLLRVLEQDA